MSAVWRQCSSCKKDIHVNSPYYVCSVSTCRQKRTNYAFCSVECWDQHIPIERHRSDNISAIEKRAPGQPEAVGADASKRRRVVVGGGGSSTSGSPKGGTSVDSEVLVVASKVKKYISERANMNCSATTMQALSEKVKLLCEAGIAKAREDGRKTVMDRDIP